MHPHHPRKHHRHGHHPRFQHRGPMGGPPPFLPMMIFGIFIFLLFASWGGWIFWFFLLPFVFFKFGRRACGPRYWGGRPGPHWNYNDDDWEKPKRKNDDIYGDDGGKRKNDDVYYV